MAIIVNDLRNLPVTISVIDIDVLEKNGIPEAFLKELLRPKNNGVGKETDSYYMITTNALLRFQFPKYQQAFLLLREFMDVCWIRNIQFIMVKKRK